MEEGCFSSLRNRQSPESNLRSQRLASGLNYPVYIITSSFNSPYLTHLQKAFQREGITLSFQNSIERLDKIPNTHERRFFIILNDFSSNPHLDGQFLKISCDIAEYPKQSLEEIMHYYHSFVQKEKQFIGQGSVITQLVFLSNMCQKRQNISSTVSETTSKIQMRSISKIVHNYKSSFPNKLFVYSNPNDQGFFSQCVKFIEQYQIQDCLYITRIEEYLRFLGSKQDIRYFLIMSQYSAINLRKYFKKCDDLVVCTKTPENCVQLLKGKVTQIVCDVKVLNSLIEKNFNCTLKNELFKKATQVKLGSGISQPIFAQNSIIQACNPVISSVLPSINRNHENLKISQQFSLITSAKKQLSIQSSIVGLTVAPQNSSVDQNDMKYSNLQSISLPSPTKTLHEQVVLTPLKIVQLEHINIASCELSQMSSLSGSNFFGEIQNKLDSFIDPFQNKIMKNYHRKLDMSNAYAQSENSMNSELTSQTSRSSQRSSKNSRIIERYRDVRRPNTQI